LLDIFSKRLNSSIAVVVLVVVRIVHREEQQSGVGPHTILIAQTILDSAVDLTNVYHVRVLDSKFLPCWC